MRRRTVVIIAVAAAAIVGGFVLALPFLRDAIASWSEEQPVAVAEWSGPAHLDLDAPVQPMTETQDGSLSWPDGRDAAVGWADIGEVEWSGGGGRMYVELVALPPLEVVLSPDETIIAYGLVLETTGDDIPDFVWGIDNNAPDGGHRAWTTNLATSETREQIGPPYGNPFDSFYPTESGPDLAGGPPSALFLPVTANRFYAWASVVTRAGEVVAWDYAPDASWLSDPNFPPP